MKRNYASFIVVALRCGARAMVVEGKKVTFLCRQSTSRNLELIETTLNAEEYQLPTQKYHQEQRNKTGFVIEGQDSKQKQTSGGKIMLTNKILKLYSTPVEREMPLKRARSVQRKGRNDRKDICSSSVEGRHWFQSATSTTQVYGNNPSCSSLQFSRNLVNDYIEKGAAKNLASCQVLASKSLDHAGQVIKEEQPWVTQRANCKRKTLEQIRPCHPGLIRKAIVSRSGHAFKVNGMALAERLKVRSTLPNFYKQTMTPSIQQHTTCVAPKHWWDYLNKKITKQLTASAPLSCETDKSCKLCQFNGSEHRGSAVRQKNTGKDVLHIDLKRLTQVRSKDWSSYGHFTRIHKLCYTKRQNNLDEKDHRVDVVDEDYLNVDVDRLMKMYEQKKSCDVGLRKSDNYESVFPPSPKSDSRGHDEGCNNKGFTFTDGAANDDGDTSIQRPGTTTLRSCLNFTSRKTCFTNVG